MRHRPDLAGNTLAEAIDMMIPRAVHKVFEKGWQTPVPLTNLTDAACYNEYLVMRQEEHTVRIGAGGTAITTAPDLPANDPAETALSLVEWLQATKRFIALVEEYFPQNAKYWQEHVRIVFQHSLRDSHWPVVLRYDIEIRKRSCSSAINPGKFQSVIFNHIMDRWRDRTADLFTHAPQAALPKPFLAVPAYTQPARSGLTRPPRPTSKPFLSEAVAFAAEPLVMEHAAALPPRYLAADLSPSPVAPMVNGTSTGPRSAINSIPWKAVTPQRARTHPMPAPSAVQPTTEPRRAGLDPRKVSCVLLPDQWTAVLDELGLLEEFHDVPEGLRNGFNIGAAGPVRVTLIQPNHKSALERPTAVLDHINTEVAAGRYTGPFARDTLEDLIGPFQTAPLGVIDKPSAPGKFRIIQDFSFPHGSATSLNSQIDTNLFSCVWGTFPEVAEAVAHAPDGSMAATFDVDAAYRQMPIRLEDQPHIVVHWGGQFWVDHRVPFGAASSNGIFGRCGDAMARIYQLRGLGQVFKWVDDFLFIHSPLGRYTPSHNLPLFSEEVIYELAARLGWPWKIAKTVGFATLFTYLGFLWDLKRRWVSIPPAKRDKYLARLRAWLARPKVSLKETEVVIGTLIHCTHAIPEGRPRLAGLIAFTASLPRSFDLRFRTVKPPPRAVSDVDWWITHLASPDCGSPVRPPPASISERIYTDASSSFGVGVIIGDEFQAWRLMGNWKSHSRDIGWAEAVAVELAVDWLIVRGTRGASVNIQCDNQGVVGAWLCGRSRNYQQNSVITRTLAKAAAHDLWIALTYIRSEDNPADRPSRGQTPSPAHASHTTVPISSALIDFLYPVRLPSSS
ncbi:hypothetical protein FRC10_010733 [Ceratobasidium sp. 414]|nr:hypothetical protein FRC10_010733 [Ceratobasidium sp. 414]